MLGMGKVRSLYVEAVGDIKMKRIARKLLLQHERGEIKLRYQYIIMLNGIVGK